MPRFSDVGDGRFHVPGCYEALMVGDGETPSPDPRLALIDDKDQLAEYHRLKAQAAREGAASKAAKLAAGEPFTTARRRFGGNILPRADDWPDWLRSPYSDVESVRVYADDTVEPV
jgi:hypothetical protein